MSPFHRPLLLSLLLVSLTAAQGQDSVPPPTTRHALIVCGLPGDAAHRVLFSSTLETLFSGLTQHQGFAPDNIRVLWSDTTVDGAGPAIAGSRGPATRENLSAAVADLTRSAQPDDALWVFVLGHANYDGKASWLNLPGPDMHQADFAKLFADLPAREQVFFLTTAASGFFIKPLAKPGRIVIAATEADRELNETIFPHKLAQAIAESPALADLDIDQDGQLSLLDLYLWTSRETAQEYATEMLLATEHAQLDDNGDGRGTEVQADFLPEELGGKQTATRKAPAALAGDGAIARRLKLAYPSSSLPKQSDAN